MQPLPMRLCPPMTARRNKALSLNRKNCVQSEKVSLDKSCIPVVEYQYNHKTP